MTSLIWIFFFQMAISLFAYVATFTGQLYFWRGYSFALLQSNYFDTTVYFSEHAISLEQLFFFQEFLFRISHLFAAVIFSE